MGQIIFAPRLRRGAKILLAEWIALLSRIAFANEGKECSAILPVEKYFFDRLRKGNLTAERMGLLQDYMRNGGDVTLKALRKLPADTQQDILDYLRDAPLYEAVTVNDKDFLLVHAGLDHFAPNKKLSEYTSDELMWASPDIMDAYFDDIITIFGHTPTFSYGDSHRGSLIKTQTWINIDVGAAFGEAPVLLRLDDWKEFRLS